MAEVALSAIGVDRPGIVAAVTGVLAARGANVEDSAMTILGGQFAMMLVVATDDPADRLRAAVEPVARDLGLVIMVTDVEDRHRAAAPTHVLSVYGADRPGIVASVTRSLADLDVNITDLNTRMLPPEDAPVYAMVLEVALPQHVDEGVVEEALAGVAEAVRVDYTLRPLEAETY
ncbi:MAG: ACT domain-containing protein [Actinomycetota bacterium]|nr:ACT domain-containing protein [Actinomycetota bacterium]